MRAQEPPAVVAPLLKWPGGKTGELPGLLPLLPEGCSRFLDPFVGGGALLLQVPPAVPAAANDACGDLMALYARTRAGDPALRAALEGLDAWWTAVEGLAAALADDMAAQFDRLRSGRDPDAAVRALLAARRRDLEGCVPGRLASWRPAFAAHADAVVPRKLRRMRRVEVDRGACLPAQDVAANLEGALKSACYATVRAAYNAARSAPPRGWDDADPLRVAAFVFLREYAYAAMFRFNASGGFNVPYGGLSYNRKRLAPKIDHLFGAAVADRLATTELACEDFATFLERQGPGPGDLVVCDPPYDSDFAAYDGRAFGVADHERLAALLGRLPCAVVVVVKATPLTERLYARPGWDVRAVDKTYAWTIKSRNDRRAVHLVVRNPDAAGRG